jgi:hypothetical protein
MVNDKKKIGLLILIQNKSRQRVGWLILESRPSKWRDSFWVCELTWLLYKSRRMDWRDSKGKDFKINFWPNSFLEYWLKWLKWKKIEPRAHSIVRVSSSRMRVRVGLAIRVRVRVPDSLLPLWFYVVNKWKYVYFVILTMTCSNC